MKLLYSFLGVLWAAVALADPSLSVSFVNTSPSGSQCISVSSANYQQETFNVVIQNINSQPVTIEGVTFNGQDTTADTTGLPNITPASDSPIEQNYFLHSCNGKQLKPHGMPGDTCTIPFVYTYSSDPKQAKTTFTVTATTDVNPTPTPTSASFTVDRTVPADAQLQLTTSNDPNYLLGRHLPNPFVNGELVDMFATDHSNDRYPTNFLYTIKNTSAVAQSFTTRCAVAPPSKYTMIAGITNNSTCDNISLLPGASCNASITINPKEDAYCTSAYVSLYVSNASSIIPTRQGPYTSLNFVFHLDAEVDACDQ